MYQFLRKTNSLLYKLASCIVLGFMPCSIDHALAQVIPGNTGYTVPVEPDKYRMFTSNGLEHWVNARQTIQYFFYLRATGSLEVSINLKSSKAGNKIKASVAGKDFFILVPKSNHFQRVRVGSLKIDSVGFYSIVFHSINSTGPIADIQSISVSGPSTKDIQFNNKERRNAASVHLRYQLPDSSKAILFYNEVMVPAESDPVFTYYMACGFKRGYFGLQRNGQAERRIIFSVWDAGSETTDRNKVEKGKRVRLFGKGKDVYADSFGNEGTGGHSHWLYNWKPGIKYQFVVTALVDSSALSTIYSGYFFVPETKKWKLIASFHAPEDASYLTNLYSFSENFDGSNGQLSRRAYFSNQWIQNINGKWTELLNARFSYDLTGKQGDRIDYGAGADSSGFYLWNGGFKVATAKYNDSFKRSTTGVLPNIDLNKNSDSTSQAETEKAIIINAISSGKYDTTGSLNGVYYQILKESKGPHLTIDDTVSVNYKGYLFNGEVFDQNKGKPATFPLKRLIRGWQIGLPMAAVGSLIRLIIPSGLAYSIKARSTKIPPNSILVFDIEVLGRK